MKNTNKVYLITTITVILIGFSFFYYEIYNRSSSTKILFNEYEHDIDIIKFGKEKGYYIVYRNIGSNELEIEGVQTSCGCTSPILSNKVISPNKRDSLYIKYHAEEYGPVSKKIYIYSNSITSPDVLYLKGIVK